jgi:hypothetical protein
VNLDQVEKLGHLDQLDKGDNLVSKVHQDLEAIQDLLDREVKLDLPEQRVQEDSQDCLDLLVQGENLVRVDSQDKLAP